jgi:hypothetical protein
VAVGEVFVSRNPCKHCEKRVHHFCTANSRDRSRCKYSLCGIFITEGKKPVIGIGVE